MPQETEEWHLGAALPPSCHRGLAFSLSRQEQFCFGLTLPVVIGLRCCWEVALWLKYARRPPAWLISQSSAGGVSGSACIYDTPAVCHAPCHMLYVYMSLTVQELLEAGGTSASLVARRLSSCSVAPELMRSVVCSTRA